MRRCPIIAHCSTNMTTVGSEMLVVFFTVIFISPFVQRSLQYKSSSLFWCRFTFSCSRGRPHGFIHLLLISTLRSGLGQGANLTPPFRRFGYCTCSPSAHFCTTSGLRSLLWRFWKAKTVGRLGWRRVSSACADWLITVPLNFWRLVHCCRCLNEPSMPKIQLFFLGGGVVQGGAGSHLKL